ncbi:MAG: class I SAM-dependent methyltransferase [Candidatus Thorarchaeota archaeon]|nr:class I SAM-dependent methyltransferase [Candidatus Thorarchaeota archaeon]
MIVRKAKAWRELMKIGLNVGRLRKEIDVFYRGNILGVLRNEGWFDYLQRPRTAVDLAAAFRYTDMEFLEYILNVLVDDGVLSRNGDEYVFQEGQVSFEWDFPSCFDISMRELWVDHARAIPDRLRGKFISFTGGLNLFNWDDALSNRLYEQIRRAAFSFADALERPVRFLDVGSGNGRGTAAIWSYYYGRGYFHDGTKMHIVGIDPSERLLSIARAEFPKMVSEYNGNDLRICDEVNRYPPEFKTGYAENIPFEDESFDIVYASQILHWTTPKQAIQEMLRVVRPGGFLFGTENFYPDANRYSEMHFKVVEGAHGFFYKTDLEQWAREAGANGVETATPISVFKITKGIA